MRAFTIALDAALADGARFHSWRVRATATMRRSIIAVMLSDRHDMVNVSRRTRPRDSSTRLVDAPFTVY